MEQAPDKESIVRALYDRYRRPLFGYVLRSVGGDYQYAEDIVQETMMRAWRDPALVEPERAGPWLFTVARNLVISGHRRRTARVSEVPIAEHEIEATDDEIGHVMQAWQVMEVLHGLSHDHREVIIELFYRRRTVTEAAKVLGIPPGTVKSRSYYALHALRAALEERGVTGS
ncbi:RNA polymerase sigma-70 factor (ECF subfamily) [Kribbella orskensis]|uniref:RNA polymerase sigma factor n=1 Tax=Kribbella orskensis TaxID=2512216 RepID=A0ABY2BMR8_9ACTN|nr:MULTISPECIES: sigma-70 family RNA polymerase sigma factor [Kribbella]TCN41830.1 RNA polymerase sigma-70 factor (ECF subfamily) [Kribbella sp. VKM Ac-2500]TCO25708.1 RNA polymerase sigma-70 factor (ECF subfamily) [Kribbella orskensis]